MVLVEGNYLLLQDDGWEQVQPMLHLSAFISCPNRIRLRRLALRHMSNGRSRAEAFSFIRSSDEPNARRIDRLASKSDFLVQIPRLPSGRAS